MIRKPEPPAWEDQPLFDVAEPEKPKKTYKKPAVTWTKLKHNRFTCEQCVTDLRTRGQSPIRAGVYMRVTETEQVVYCNVHAADKKMADEKAGIWNQGRK